MDQNHDNPKPKINPIILVVLAGFLIGVYFSFKPALLQPQAGKKTVKEVQAVFLTVTPELSMAYPTSPPDREKATLTPRMESGPVVGMLAPDFALKTLDGKTGKLSAYKDQAIVINFWATWCPPCKEEMPALQAAYEKYKDKGLVILGIDLLAQDNLADVQSFVKEYKVTYPILLDESGDLSGMGYALRGMPTSFFVSRDGRIKRIQIGALSTEAIEQFVAEILQ